MPEYEAMFTSVTRDFIILFQEYESYHSF